jgi:transcriptional antiterminator RfaH
MQYWYTLYTKPHCERQVEGALTAKGIETFFPSMPVLAPRRGRSPIRPYFPCYLFARFDLEAIGISPINWTPGMRHVVMFGGLPAGVQDVVIDRIREHLQQPHAMDEQGEFLQSGDHVMITSGPLRDIEAVFDKRLSTAGRVRVLVQLLERWTTCEMEATGLRRLPASRTVIRRHRSSKR